MHRFLQLILDGTPTTHPRKNLYWWTWCEVFPEAKICIGNGPLAGGTCGGHLWGGHPSKPQKKQFFHLTVVGKLSCFRELHFFPKQLKIQLLPKTQICIGNEIEYQHAHILCMVFCNLFSRNGLNLYCSNMLKPFPMDLHHLWGGPFAVKKMHFLVHKVEGNLSVSRWS